MIKVRFFYQSIFLAWLGRTDNQALRGIPAIDNADVWFLLIENVIMICVVRIRTIQGTQDPGPCRQDVRSGWNKSHKCTPLLRPNAPHSPKITNKSYKLSNLFRRETTADYILL